MEHTDKEFCLEVWGDLACFTRPEFKVERVSYDFITPSAARAIFEAIFWKPAIRWQVTKIEVLKPIEWTSVKRNEVGATAKWDANHVPLRFKQEGKKEKVSFLYAEDHRQQRNTLMLKGVSYRIYAKLVFIPVKSRSAEALAEHPTDYPNENPKKYYEEFERRACKGKCFAQPYFGNREFSAHFRLIENEADKTGAPIPVSKTFGDMFYDWDYSKEERQAMTFCAKMKNGVVEVPSLEDVKETIKKD